MISSHCLAQQVEHSYIPAQLEERFSCFNTICSEGLFLHLLHAERCCLSALCTKCWPIQFCFFYTMLTMHYAVPQEIVFVLSVMFSCSTSLILRLFHSFLSLSFLFIYFFYIGTLKGYKVPTILIKWYSLEIWNCKRVTHTSYLISVVYVRYVVLYLKRRADIPSWCHIFLRKDGPSCSVCNWPAKIQFLPVPLVCEQPFFATQLRD